MEGTGIFLQLQVFLMIGLATHIRNVEAESNDTFTSPNTISSSTPSPPHTSISSTEQTASTKENYKYFLLDTEMNLIVLGSAGCLVVILLVSTVILACQVCRLKRQAGAPRPAHSNVDLVGGTGYWGTENAEGGIVGPCDASVMLEEVQMVGDVDEEEEKENEREEDEKKGEDLKADEAGQSTSLGSAGETAMQMQSSTSRDSYMEVPQDLENMPLVV